MISYMLCMSSKQSKMDGHALPYKRQQRAEIRKTASTEHDPMHRMIGQVGCNLTHSLSAVSVASSSKWPSWCSIPRRFAEQRKRKRHVWCAT